MNKYSFKSMFLVVLLVISGLLDAAYLNFVPQDVRQPDGTAINMFASGDEYYNWMHDKDGYTVKQNSSGWYVYLDKNAGGELVFTDYVAGVDNPATHNLTPWINISPDRMGDIRKRAQHQLQSIGSGRAPTSGTINNLVIFIRFSDQSEYTQSLSTYNSMFNGTTGNTMQSYFLEASYNALSISTSFYPPASTTVVSWQDTAHNRAYYMPYDASTNPTGYNGDTECTTREHTLLVNAVNGVSASVPAGLNIDGDNDGKVDNVCFIIQGATTAWSTLLWPHRWALYTQVVNINGKRVYDYNFQLSTYLSSSGASVLCHEMFHSLGAPDLYHYTSDGNSPAGSWDLMCSNTSPPQHMTAFMKMKYGHWISSIPTLYTSGTYTLNPLTSSTGQSFRINSPNNLNEYFVVEFRKKTGTFETALPGSGIIIYRINTTCGDGNADGPPDELYIYRLNGTTTANGTPNSANFSTETARTSFNGTTNPSCFLSDGSNGGISLSAVSSSSGSTMSFYYTFVNPPSGLAGSSANSTINLSWAAPQYGVPSSYKIYRNSSYIGTSATLTYTDANVVAGTSYSYYVTAVFSNPSAETAASNTINVTASDISIIAIGAETNTNKGLPVEPYYGYTYSQSIYLQSQISVAGKSISKIAWQYNGNSAWTDAIKIWLGHTSLTSFASTSSWIPPSNMTLVYNGNITTTTSAGWAEVTLDTLFNYNNTQNLVIAVDENTSGYHSGSDEFYNTAVSGNRSIHYYNDNTNPDPASPPTSGNYLYTKAFVPNLRLTFSTNPIFAITPVSVDFGQVQISTFNLRTVRVTNTGNGSLSLSSISLNNVQFALMNLPTLPKTLTQNQYTEFQIKYNPQAEGSNSAVLTIVDNLTRVSRTANVTGSCLNTAIAVFPWSCSFDAWAPANWNLSGGSNNWIQHTVASPNNYSARANLSAWTSGAKANLITPPLRPTITSKLRFRWSHLYNASNPGDSLKVYYSINCYNWTLLWQTGGSAFNSADGAGATAPGSYVYQDVALPSDHIYQNFFIRFEAVSGHGSDLFVDDVTVKSLLAIALNLSSFTYGAVPVGTSSSQTLIIQNNGDDPLTGSLNPTGAYTVSAAGSNVGLRNLMNFSIPGNSSASFNLIFTPLGAQTYNSSFYVNSNDLVQPAKLIRLYGSGYLPARISIAPGSISAAVSDGDVSIQNLVLSNVGNLSLDYTIQVTEPGRNDDDLDTDERNTAWLSLNSLSGTIGVSQNFTLIATLNSQGLTAGIHQAILNIASNDPVNPVIQVPVSLTVTSLAPVSQIVSVHNGVTISWAPVTGALLYRVYKSTYENGTYQQVTSTTQTSWTDTANTRSGFYKITAVLN